MFRVIASAWCRRRFSVWSVSFLALATAPCVHAQEAGDEAGEELDTIIVTGTRVPATGSKSDTPVVEVPQSLSIVGSELMTAQGIQTVSQAIAYQAGVANGSTPANGRYDRISLRGFDVTNTGVLQDGLRATTAQTYTKAEPYGLERIEVLRGPASVLYGQNAPGGLVNMVSKRPTDTPLYEVGIQTGSFDRIQGQFDFSGPLNDAVAVRLTGLAREADTQIEEIPDNKLFIAPALAWEPAAGTEITLLTSYSYEEYGPPAFGAPIEGTLLPNPNGKVSRDLYTDEPGVDNHRDQFAAAVLLDQELGGGWMLRSALRYTSTDFLSNTVSARGAAVDGRLLNRSYYRFRIDGDVWATDNQVFGDWQMADVDMKTMVGIDYRHTREDYYLKAGPAAPLDVFDPVYGQPYGPATTPFSDTLQSSDQTGLYVEQQARFDNGLIFSAALRQDWSDTTTEDRLGASDTSQDDEATTWRAGVVYRGPWGMTPYVSYSTSFNPILGSDFYGDPYEPSEGEQVEGGLRFEPSGWRTYLTLAGYRLTQTNVRTTDPDNALNQIQTGEVRSQGFEAEVVSSPLEGLNLVASLTLADLEVTHTTDMTALGQTPTGSPEETAALWADYTLSSGPLDGLGFGGGVRYVGETYADAANTITVPDYTVIDAMLRYDFGDWRVSLNASNLFDEDYYVRCSTNSCGIGAERTVMATLRYRWGGE